MKLLKLVLISLVLTILVPSFSYAQTQYRLAFIHDGVNTDRYELRINSGAITVFTPINLVPLLPTGQNKYVVIPTPAAGNTYLISACNSLCSSSTLFTLTAPGAPTGLTLVVTTTVP